MKFQIQRNSYNRDALQHNPYKRDQVPVEAPSQNKAVIPQAYANLHPNENVITELHANTYNTNPDAGGCPQCHKNLPIEAVRVTSFTQWKWCLGLGIVLLPLSWIPFCVQSCDDIKYECSGCKTVRSYYRAPCCA